MLLNRQFKRKKIYLIILISLFLLGLIFFGYKIFTENKITRVNVNAQNLNCTTSSDIELAIKKMNINYFYFQKEPLEVDLRKKYLCIGKIESQISYPNQLKLKIQGREAKFVVSNIKPTIETNPTINLTLDQLNATQSTTEAFPPKILNQILDHYQDSSVSAFYLVDEEGTIFEEVNSDLAFPKLSFFSQDLKVGQKLPNDIIIKVAEVVDKLKLTYIPSDNLLVVGDKLIIDSKPRIIFALNKPIDRQSASLQLILRQAKMKSDPDSKDSKSVESIDLRFDRPVVVYSKQ